MTQENVSATVTVPLLDLKAQYATLRDEIRAAMDRVSIPSTSSWGQR